MLILIRRLLILTLISLLSACSHMSGNVVPETGPTMEQVYDSRTQSQPIEKQTYSKHHASQQSNDVLHDFHKLPNPELKMYIYPHLAGKEQLPIPGYYTVFNGYTQDHYALANE